MLQDRYQKTHQIKNNLLLALLKIEIALHLFNEFYFNRVPILQLHFANNKQEKFIQFYLLVCVRSNYQKSYFLFSFEAGKVVYRMLYSVPKNDPCHPIMLEKIV